LLDQILSSRHHEILVQREQNYFLVFRQIQKILSNLIIPAYPKKLHVLLNQLKNAIGIFLSTYGNTCLNYVF